MFFSRSIWPISGIRFFLVHHHPADSAPSGLSLHTLLCVGSCGETCAQSLLMNPLGFHVGETDFVRSATDVGCDSMDFLQLG